MIAYKSKLINGNEVLLTNSIGQSYHSDNLEYLLDFLLEPHGEDFKIAWDIDKFVAPILKLIDRDNLKRLFQTGKAYLRPHTLTYNQNKSVFITKGSWRASIYHMKQYYPDDNEISLAETATKGDKLLKELAGIDIKPTRLSSPVAMLDSVMDKFNLPTHEDIPDDVGQYSWECSSRNWVEAIKLGHFLKVYDFDLTSGFPSVMANLMDTRYGTWVYSNEQPPNAKYGFCYGRVTINKDVKLSPIVFTDKNGHLLCPTGSWYTFLTMQEIDFIYNYNLGHFKITDGHWWIPKQRVYPLQLLMIDLFNKRRTSPLLNRVIKRMQTGVYGRFGQVFPEGRFAHSFFPPWFSVIETLPRITVAKFIYDNNLVDNILHIATDGFLSDKEIPIENNGRMGSWRLDSTGPALIVSSGMLFYGDKHPCQLYYPEALELMKSKPKLSEWSNPIKRTMTLGDMFLDEFTEIGEERTVTTGFSLKTDHDRDFKILPTNGEELLNNIYDSKPLKASQLSKPESKAVESTT